MTMKMNRMMEVSSSYVTVSSESQLNNTAVGNIDLDLGVFLIRTKFIGSSNKKQEN